MKYEEHRFGTEDYRLDRGDSEFFTIFNFSDMKTS
jgi:hypothetical protein